MELDALSSVLEHSQLNEQVYSLLKSEILRGNLRSGQRLSITELASHLCISATPVRDALRKLEADGLVCVVPRSGTYVSEFTPDQVREVFQSRRIIEGAAIDHLLVCTPERLDHMRQILDREESLLGAPTFQGYQRRLALDDEFHHCIVQLLCNSQLSRFYEQLRWPIQVTRGLLNSNHDRAQAKVREHQAILKAIERGDAAAAKAVLLQHLYSAERHLLENMAAAGFQAPTRPVSRSPQTIDSLAAAG